MIGSMSKLGSKLFLAGVGLALAVGLLPARAEDVAPADAQAVVEKQIHAFERGDDASAWNLAAPEIREKFSNAAEFTQMVRERYAPVYSHRSVEFGPASRRGDDVGMVVTLVSNDNEVWKAIFVVTKQGDGGWRTSSCLLAKAPQTSL